VRADQPRVVVTGLGATTPLGGDVPSTWEGMLAGRSGVTVLTDDGYASLPARIAAAAAVDPATVLDRVQARRLDRCEQFAIVAAREAWADAGAPEVPPERLGVVVASGIGGISTILAGYDTLRDRGWRRLSPFTVPMLMPNGSAGWIGIELGARAGVHTTVSACASGAEAIGYAVDMIRLGRADVVLAGGTEAAIIPLNIAAFAAMQAVLADAGLDPDQVVHVNAHATSTPAGDAVEGQAIAAALGPAADGVVVSATKSMTGHLLGGAGAVEAVATVLALRDRVAPPTINLDDLDSEARVDIATKPRELAPHGRAPMAALNNSFGFGGHNVTLAFTAA